MHFIYARLTRIVPHFVSFLARSYCHGLAHCFASHAIKTIIVRLNSYLNIWMHLNRLNNQAWLKTVLSMVMLHLVWTRKNNCLKWMENRVCRKLSWVFLYPSIQCFAVIAENRILSFFLALITYFPSYRAYLEFFGKVSTRPTTHGRKYGVFISCRSCQNFSNKCSSRAVWDRKYAI